MWFYQKNTCTLMMDIKIIQNYLINLRKEKKRKALKLAQEELSNRFSGKSDKLT